MRGIAEHDDGNEQYSPMPLLVGVILAITAILLLLGRYTALDYFIKIVSIVLLVTVFIACFAVLFKGSVEKVEDFQPSTIFEGAGLALMISLIGWMPSGMEASTMHSIWAVEKMRNTKYHPTLGESLFDFNLGYIFTTVLALIFLAIGALTVYGSGQSLDGNSTQFSNKLLDVFTSNLGEWSFQVMAIAAFSTIYGTLITAWDAFTRSFVRGLRTFKFSTIQQNTEQQRFLHRNYTIFLIVIGVGSFLLFYFSARSMIKILEGATIVAFITAPIIAYLNLQAMRSEEVPITHRPSQKMINFCYTGLVAMISFSIFYLVDLLH